MTEPMDLETYKQKVREILMRSGSSDFADERMKLYEDEFSSEFWEKNWSPDAVAAAMIMGY